LVLPLFKYIHEYALIPQGTKKLSCENLDTRLVLDNKVKGGKPGHTAG